MATLDRLAELLCTPEPQRWERRIADDEHAARGADRAARLLRRVGLTPWSWDAIDHATQYRIRAARTRTSPNRPAYTPDPRPRWLVFARDVWSHTWSYAAVTVLLAELGYREPWLFVALAVLVGIEVVLVAGRAHRLGGVR